MRRQNMAKKRKYVSRTERRLRRILKGCSWEFNHLPEDIRKRLSKLSRKIFPHPDDKVRNMEAIIQTRLCVLIQMFDHRHLYGGRADINKALTALENAIYEEISKIRAK
jgi:hypothetical protein